MQTALIRFFLAMCVGALLGVGVGVGLRAYRTSSQPASSVSKSLTTGAVKGAGEVDHPAWRYARALQEGACEDVVEMTLWMQERLKRVAAMSDSADAVQEARAALCAEVGVREPAGNQLTGEGIEDKYVFAPGATLEVVAVDAGQEDLAAPVKERVWIRVTYPSRMHALRDSASLPIRSLTVGVNVSEQDQILKANIVGNVEVYTESISYAW